MRLSRTPRRVQLVAVAALLTTGPLSVMTASTASADSVTYTVSFTGGIGAFPRSQPVYDARTGDALPEGASIEGTCWVDGESITNPDGYTSTVWVKSADGLYWAEAWLDTGSEGVPAGLPSCDTSVSPEPAAALANDFFNRSGTRKWALDHAMDTPPSPWVPGCTWFASQALWAGGFPQDAEWTSSGSHGTIRRVDGSVTAWSAPEFVSYLTNHYDVSLESMDFTANAVPSAAVGDIVAYDWTGDGVIDHVAVVTDIEAGSYPNVSEWGVGRGFLDSGPAGYSERGWTYSDKHDAWLQAQYPDVQATLIHFNGGFIIDNYDDLGF